MSENLVTYTVKQNIAHIGLNDTARLNVLSIPLVKDLNTAIANAENNPDVKVILLFGHGRGFCAGGDLKEFYNLTEQPKHDLIEDWMHIYQCELPVIAATHGYVIGGGCELIMMSDYVIAADNSTFSQPELKLGFIPGCGATKNLQTKIGYGNAFDMIATGKKINATCAKDIGLINEITSANDIHEIAHTKAIAWAERTKEELVQLKKTLRKKDLAYERKVFYEMVCSKSAKNHINSFLNK
jgi:enoyl-CoA hydratase/carnithine racemase